MSNLSTSNNFGWIQCVSLLILALSGAGCLTSEPGEEPPTAPPDVDAPDLRRESESQEFAGKLPVTIAGNEVGGGNSSFQAAFERSPYATMIEVVISPDGFKAPGYNVTFEMGGRKVAREFSGVDPFVFHTDSPGPYIVTLRAVGPDVAGTEWTAKVTQFYLVPE